MAREHTYEATVTWTGNRGRGTAGYKAYTRDHDIACPGKPAIRGSADLGYRGDASRHNPEDLLVAALLRLSHALVPAPLRRRGVAVTAYEDAASGAMATNPDGSGEFTRVTLAPRVTIAADSCAETAARLHGTAHAMCFIARSVNFPVEHRPAIVRA